MCSVALNNVPLAAAAEGEGADVLGSGDDADGGASFSFQHVQGGFGSFNSLGTMPS